jgi:serine phosphatase RsbU (regulator of sigma subunit)
VGVFDVWPGGDGVLRLVLVEVGGLGPTAGAVLASETARTLLRETIPGTPKAALTTVNRKLVEMRLPETAVVSAAVGVVHAESGRVTVACAGLPSPVLVPAVGQASVWHGSGPFLATSDAEFHDITGQLNRGEKVVLLGGGAAADRRPDVRAVAETHRSLAAQPFADAVAKELLTDADPDDGFTLLAVELKAD